MPSRANLVASPALPYTTIAAHFAVPIHPGQNLIACASLSLAWQRFTELAGALDIRQHLDSVITQLQQLQSAAFALPPDSYVALAGFGRDQIDERIQQAVREYIDGPLPFTTTPTAPDAVVAFSLLQRNLSFAQAFERLDKPLLFGGITPVTAFGVQRQYPAATQIQVLDYQDATNFVLEVATTSSDQLLLAKVPPAQTLEVLIEQILERTRPEARAARLEQAQANVDQDLLERLAPRIQAMRREQVRIPHVECQIHHVFRELGGRPFTTNKYPQVILREVEQTILFSLSETGAMLQSAARVGAVLSIQPEPRQFVFDQPFLIWLKAPEAKLPYLVLWIGNTELLVPGPE